MANIRNVSIVTAASLSFEYSIGDVKETTGTPPAKVRKATSGSATCRESTDDGTGDARFSPPTIPQTVRS